jgi:histidinol dehydrogenase
MTADVRLIRRRADEVVAPVATPPSPAIVAAAADIVAEVRDSGEEALRRYAARFDGLVADRPLVIGAADLRKARLSLPQNQQDLLERTAERIAVFARAQRASLSDLDVPVPGGRAGHRVMPLKTAGCYAPAGRYPLPSSVLMTAVTARTAGVETVIVATPSSDALMLAAADIAGADMVLCAGGAQAVAALAHGVAVPACDVIVGPGNAWVTAAKLLVADRVRTDGAAGPSELVVVADGSSDPERVAADLLAQAEHDPLARVVLVALDEGVIGDVERSLTGQLVDLPTRGTAREALGHAVGILVDDVAEAVALCNRLAPEHLQWTAGGGDAPDELECYGGLFAGADAAEVLGDYGAGPNHVLPTGGQARSRGGLSVFDFLAVRTWLRIEDTSAVQGLARDAAELAKLEGLVGHGRAAGLREG